MKTRTWVTAAVIAGALLLIVGLGAAYYFLTPMFNPPPPSPSSARPTPSPAPSQKQQDLKVGETATYTYSTMTMHDYVDPAQPTQGNPFMQPKQGNRYVAADVEGCIKPDAPPDENGQTLRQINPFDFTLQMPDNTRIHPTIGAVEPALNYTALSPGDCARGWVTFELPQNQKPSYLVDYASGSQMTARWAVS